MALPQNKLPLPGFRLIADNAGNYIDDLNNIRLSDKFTLSRNTADPSASIDLDLSTSDVSGLGSAAALNNSGTTVGRADIPVVLARSTPAGVNTPLTATFAAGAYKEIIIKFNGRTNGYLQVRVNGDTGNNYSDFAINCNSIVSADNAVKGTNGFARILVTAVSTSACKVKAEFCPLTTGFERVGTATAISVGTAGTEAQAFERHTGFCWHNSVDDVTSVTVFPLSGQNMTGILEIAGIPA